ncbi:S8 family serine peptidase [Mumia qirimensis]|uniref:S8 family serine peptidase n=1 Tax=Mumia qirimensis TaxID=3234852 RepID=UPI00351CCA80
MPRLIRPLALVASASLVLAVAAPAIADPAEPRGRAATPGTAAAPGESPAPLNVAPAARAVGLLITYDDAAQSVTKASRRVVESQGLDTEATTTPVEDGVAALAFDAPASLAEAEQAAKKVEALPGVASVEPDVLVTAAAAPPVLNDSAWWQQWYIRDTFGTHSYAAWPATTGRVVVGVIDTGQTSHPDLDGKMVAGMDFISAAWVARDGHGRDTNPRDEGDWLTGAEGCGAATSSSWHGTHVAGIVGARANNGQGIVGNAPGVRIQHLRVLGTCGGSTSDMAAAITWGSGGTVGRLPRNRTPAKVLNLSLSGRSDICPSPLRKAILNARARGSVVVVAAGNDRMDARLFTPANCPGVVVVGATNKLGQSAGKAPVNGLYHPYSNYGPAVDLSAPGGDLVNGGAILSTVNAGATRPTSAAWAQQAGTSMASPSVAAAAALIASTGYHSPATIEHALRWAVRPFPAHVSGYAPCVRADCGTGILDVSRLTLAKTSPVLRGVARRGQVLTTNAGTWLGSPTGYSVRWLRSGVPIPGAYASSYRVAVADGGALIQAQVAGRKGAGSPVLWRSTAGLRVPKVASAVRLRVKPKATRYGRNGAKLVATVRVAAGSAKGKIVFRDGKKRLKSVKLKKGKAVLTLRSTRLKRGKHTIRATFVPKRSAFSRSVSRPRTLRVR